MKLIVGLGNPGTQYEKTRHNLGFRALAPFGPFTVNKSFNSFISKEGEVICVMPQTFMNESGRAVQAAAQFYKISPADIWIIHDEIDLPLGTIRISFDSSSAGHKGVASIINALGTQAFYRFRLGIMSDTKGQIPTEDFVLQPFTPQEQSTVESMVHKTQLLIPTALEKGISSIINDVNK